MLYLARAKRNEHVLRNGNPETLMLDERDLDEVDLLLIPVSAGISRVRRYLDSIGVARSQQLLVLRERLDVTRQILIEDAEAHEVRSTAIH